MNVGYQRRDTHRKLYVIIRLRYRYCTISKFDFLEINYLAIYFFLTNVKICIVFI